MEPVNTKSLLAFIFGTMGKLDRGEIDSNVACAQAKLAAQAHNILDYELKRSLVQIQLCQMGRGISPELRDIESKAFDDAKLTYHGEQKVLS